MPDKKLTRYVCTCYLLALIPLLLELKREVFFHHKLNGMRAKITGVDDDGFFHIKGAITEQDSSVPCTAVLGCLVEVNADDLLVACGEYVQRLQSWQKRRIAMVEIVPGSLIAAVPQSPYSFIRPGVPAVVVAVNVSPRPAIAIGVEIDGTTCTLRIGVNTSQGYREFLVDPIYFDTWKGNTFSPVPLAADADAQFSL